MKDFYLNQLVQLGEDPYAVLVITELSGCKQFCELMHLSDVIRKQKIEAGNEGSYCKGRLYKTSQISPMTASRISDELGFLAERKLEINAMVDFLSKASVMT